jgi:hypothetical protein
MKIRTIGYTAFIAAAAVAFAFGTSGPSQAKHKKAEAKPMACWTKQGPVCGTRGGMSFTYANSCYAERDGAKVVAWKACPAKKAMKAHKKTAKKMAKKPAKADKKK